MSSHSKFFLVPFQVLFSTYQTHPYLVVITENNNLEKKKLAELLHMGVQFKFWYVVSLLQLYIGPMPQ